MPRNGRPRSRTASCQRLDHARDVGEALAAIGEGADAGQHHPLSRPHDFGLGRDGDLERRAAFPRRALEGFGGGVEIPRTVIDDGDIHGDSSLREQPDDLLALAARHGR